MLIACCCHGGFGARGVPDDGVGLGDVVALLVGGGVTVGVPDGGKAWKRPVLVNIAGYNETIRSKCRCLCDAAQPDKLWGMGQLTRADVVPLSSVHQVCKGATLARDILGESRHLIAWSLREADARGRVLPTPATSTTLPPS